MTRDDCDVDLHCLTLRDIGLLVSYRTKTDVSKANFVEAYFSKGYMHGM